MRRALRFYASSFHELPREVWLLAAVMLVNRAGTMVLPFLALYLVAEQGMSPARAGLLVGSFGVGSMAGSWLGGWLSDRVEPNLVQRWSLFATGAGFVVLGQLEGFWPLLAGIVVVATVADAFRPAVFTAVTRYTPGRRRARAFALVRLAVNLGMMIGPAVGGWLAVRDWGLLFWADGATCVAAALLLWVVLGPTPDPRRAAREAGEELPAARSPWRDRRYLAFLGLVTLLAMGFLQILSTWPLALHDAYALGEDQIGGLLALNALAVAILEMPFLKAVEGLRPMKVAAWGGLLTCGGMAIVAFGPPIGWALLALAVWTVGEMLSLPMTNAIVAELADENSTGAYMGAYSLAFSLAFVLAPIVGTNLYQHGGPNILWGFMAALGFALLLGFARLDRMRTAS